MIHNGATNSFITLALAQQCNLQLVTTDSVPIFFVQGSSTANLVAKEVKMESCAWSGILNFLVVDMPEYNVILGLDWMNKYLISFFGKKCDKLLLDNLDGVGGVLVNLFRGLQVHTTKTYMPQEKLCSTKVANRVLKKVACYFFVLLKINSQTQWWGN